MKYILLCLVFCTNIYSQSYSSNYSYVTYLGSEIDLKTTAKDVAQYRSKEFLINNIIGSTKGNEIKFETESLASDDSAGLVSVAYNCDDTSSRGLLLAFVGWSKNRDGYASKAYGFRAIPLESARALLDRIEKVIEGNKKYITSDTNVNNVYIEFEDIKFVIYRDVGSKIRVFWNGFEVVWEDVAFSKSKRRLDKWFK